MVEVVMGEAAQDRSRLRSTTTGPLDIDVGVRNAAENRHPRVLASSVVIGERGGRVTTLVSRSATRMLLLS